jgi:hypothetical protein
MLMRSAHAPAVHPSKPASGMAGLIPRMVARPNATGAGAAAG